MAREITQVAAGSLVTDVILEVHLGNIAFPLTRGLRPFVHASIHHFARDDKAKSSGLHRACETSNLDECGTEPHCAIKRVRTMAILDIITDAIRWQPSQNQAFLIIGGAMILVGVLVLFL